jgi:uncharacterized protein (DUF1330 family)
MSVYYINSYDIDNMDEFKNYGLLVLPLILRYGGEVLVSDLDAMALEGKPRKMNAIIRFPSLEAALNCYNDPAYTPIKQIRLNSTSNCTMLLTKEFVHKH